MHFFVKVFASKKDPDPIQYIVEAASKREAKNRAGFWHHGKVYRIEVTTGIDPAHLDPAFRDKFIIMQFDIVRRDAEASLNIVKPRRI
jgi:hypothetical protein